MDYPTYADVLAARDRFFVPYQSRLEIGLAA